MSTARKIGAYGVILALVAAGAYGLGAAVGPFEAPASDTHQVDSGHTEGE
ncbi:hypothetical protein [Alloactinosynnema sp. L-07]|nr:hypothetical protein [Alloactinosynnema sp. L-07]CRK57315.1 hypothetical protein [Alloactinosynnema sp. L-07]